MGGFEDHESDGFRPLAERRFVLHGEVVAARGGVVVGHNFLWGWCLGFSMGRGVGKEMAATGSLSRESVAALS